MQCGTKVNDAHKPEFHPKRCGALVSCSLEVHVFLWRLETEVRTAENPSPFESIVLLNTLFLLYQIGAFTAFPSRQLRAIAHTKKVLL